jgi:hypothetical protein
MDSVGIYPNIRLLKIQQHGQHNSETQQQELNTLQIHISQLPCMNVG